MSGNGLAARALAFLLALTTEARPGNGGASETLRGILGELPKEAWEYSASGGYVFRHAKDLVGDEAPETVINFSVQPDVWHVYTASGEFVTTFAHPAIAQLAGEKVGAATVVRSTYAGKNYDQPPFKAFGEHVIDTTVSESGTERSIRLVGEDATHEEYMEAGRGAHDAAAAQTATVEWLSLQDYLTTEEPEWLHYDRLEWVKTDGYFIHNDDIDRAWEMKTTSDESKIKDLIGNFTAPAAIAALNKLATAPTGSTGLDSKPKDHTSSRIPVGVWVLLLVAAVAEVAIPLFIKARRNSSM